MMTMECMLRAVSHTGSSTVTLFGEPDPDRPYRTRWICQIDDMTVDGETAEEAVYKAVSSAGRYGLGYFLEKSPHVARSFADLEANIGVLNSRLEWLLRELSKPVDTLRIDREEEL